jgi:hypothetical protein
MKFGLSTSVLADKEQKIDQIPIRHYALRQQIDYDYEDDDIEVIGAAYSMNWRMYSLAIFSSGEYVVCYMARSSDLAKIIDSKRKAISS